MIRERIIERLRLSLEIPTDPKPIVTTARVVRTTHEGLGVRFEEVSVGYPREWRRRGRGSPR